MTRTIVGVLRGGTSSEYDLSLKTGAAMMAALPEARYEPRDIFIDKTGLWHVRGIPVTPARALAQVDVVVNALHGGVGEDGTLQRLLQGSGVPFTGSAALASGLALNKIRAREILQRAGVRLPQAVAFSVNDRSTTGEMARLLFSKFAPPYVLKPPLEGASYGIRIVNVLGEAPNALGDLLDRFGSVLVEEYIPGKEASVCLIERFRRQHLYALPPARLVLPSGARMVERSHYDSGSIDVRVPSDFSYAEKRALMEAARTAHRALGLRHFSHANFIVAPSKGNPRVYLLDVDTTPGLYPGAAFPPMLESIGSSVSEFLEHAITLARSQI